MAFEIKNPTLKNIIDFLRNQLGSMSLIDDAPSDSKKYSRKNGFWVEVNDSGGGGEESTNIGDEVYTEGDQLIIHSASTQVQDFFDNIAPKFDNTVSNSTNDIVVYDNKLFTLTEGHTAPATWENTTHVTTSINNILKNKVNIDGDTMTGVLKINPNNNTPGIHLIHDGWNNSATSLSTQCIGTFDCKNKDSNDLLSFVQTTQNTNGSVTLQIGARKKINNSNVTNSITFKVNNDSTKEISITDKSAWLTALGLEDSDWQSYTDSEVFSGTIYYRKIGNVLYYTANDIKLINSCSDYCQLGRIPSGYRPTKDLVFSCFINTSLVNTRPIVARITTTGLIYLYANKDQTIEPNYNILMSGCGI